MQQFSTGHKDLVLAIAYNLYGTRLATASADHLLKVWDQRPDSDEWSVTDTWLAHDAEVTDVKWTYPFVGEHIGSVGEDGTLKIWQEDVNQSINSSRRFTKIFQLNTSTDVPFMSLDFKSIATDTFLAAITRDGHLTVCEPDEQGSLAAWKTIWSDYICRTPSRMQENSFRVTWHKEKLPAWPAVSAGLDRKSLALAVSVGETVRVLRTDKDRKFYDAAMLDGSSGLVRDVDWANGSVRGFDIIATACKDGFVRIYELHTPEDIAMSAPRPGSTTQSTPALRPIRSGIGAGLAGSTKNKHEDGSDAPGVVRQDVKLAAELATHAGMPWRVTWSFAGDFLASTGDDGSVKFWKKSVDGKWMEVVDIEPAKA